MKRTTAGIIPHSLMILIMGTVLWQLVLLQVAKVDGDDTSFRGPLTEAETSWLRAHPVIRLAPDPEFQPIEFFDKNGNYAGIGADYVRLIEKKIGLRFEIVRCASWDEVVSRIKSREVDVLNAVVRTPERENYLNFPAPYLTIPSVIIARKNVTTELTLDNLNGLHVVMVSGYGYVDLIRNLHPEIEIELVANLKSALRKVSFGMADAFVGDLATASFYIETEGITNLKLAGESQPPNVSGFAVRSDWPELNNILEKGVAMLTEEERKAIRNKWIHLETAPGITMGELRNLILIAMAVVLLIIAVFLFWNRMLNRMVRKRTEDLSKEVEERKIAELALKESEEKFRAMADTSPLAIYMSEGKEEKGVYINAAFIKLFGYTLDEVPEVEHWWPLAYPDAVYRQQVADEWQRKVAKAIETKSEIDPMEVVVTCKDGSEKNISWGFFSIGKQNWACGLDLTERKQAEEKRAALEAQIRQSHKMEAIGTLAGGIAHDFNNILAAILGYTDMALDDTPDDSPAKYQMEQVLKAGNRAKDLVKHILTFSRKEVREKTPVRIHLVIREALRLLRASIPTTIDIKEDIDSQCGNVLADSTQIHQVMMNLCTNAAQAMDENGGILEVKLTSTRLDADDLKNEPRLKPGWYVKLSIRDTGVGIDNKYIDRIFDPYFTTKDIGKGSGMGLAVVIGIVKSHDGMITVSSKTGAGTTVDVYLPRVDEPQQEEMIENHPRPMGKESILVIDDEEIMVDMMRRMIERLGYQVTTRTNSLDALELFRSQPEAFDLILTDQTMPKLTGEHLAMKLLDIRPNIPIIICTGYSAKVDAKRAEQIGIRALLMKPVDIRELAENIRLALDAGEC